MLNKLNKEPVYNDRLVILDANGTADIAAVYDQDDTTLYGESASHDYAVPLTDVIVKVGSTGRIYVLGADSEYISDTRRLAALEQSIVIRQVTQFEKERQVNKKQFDLKQLLIYAMIAILLLAVIFK